MRLIEQANRGLGAGLNAGFRASPARYYLAINSDAWVVGRRRRAARRLRRGAPRGGRRRAAPRRTPTARSSAPCAAFPTPWRLATEYLFLRKLAPRSRRLNAFYAGGFEHDAPREIEWAMGSCFLVRRAACDAVGLYDEDFFLFSEETDWFYRFHLAGWKLWFIPDAEVVHVGGASHGGRMFTENLRGHLRFFAKHRGAREAERVRLLLLAGVRLRGLLFRGERGQAYRDAARWLASGSAGSLLER